VGEVSTVAPLTVLQGQVPAYWVDYNGHMSESCYLLAFGDASDVLFRLVGIDDAYRASGRSVYTVETHLNNYREAAEGDPYRITTQLLGVVEKRMHVFHAMYHGELGHVLATAEQMIVHVDMSVPRAAPFPPEILARLEQVRAAHAHLPIPQQAGRRIELRTSTVNTGT
jgi:carnitine 3-dehydrogenase